MRQALELALEALEANLGNWRAKTKAITAIKEALAHCPDCGKLLGDVDHIHTCSPQRTWIGLTEEEIDQLLTSAGFTRSDLLMMGACVDQVIDLVANKLKEKNT